MFVIRLFICHAISLTTGRNSTKIATSRPLMVRVCESNIIFPCVRACIHRPTVCLSCFLLLNLWAEFNLSCYITSVHGKGVRQQHYFSVRPAGLATATLFFCASISPCIHRPPICSSHHLLLNHWVEFNQTSYISSPYGKSVREQLFSVFPSFCASVVCLSVWQAIFS